MSSKDTIMYIHAYILSSRSPIFRNIVCRNGIGSLKVTLKRKKNKKLLFVSLDH